MSDQTTFKYTQNDIKRLSSHVWTADDIRFLEQAVLDSLPLLDHYTDRGYYKKNWWDAVSGVLFSYTSIKVTGKACYTKYREVNANRDKYKNALNSDINTVKKDDDGFITRSEMEFVLKRMCVGLGLDYSSIFK